MTSLVNTSLRIQWSQPSDNFKTITKYKVVIEDHLHAGNFVENTYYCDGSDATVMSLLRCDIPVITVLRQAPYSLTQGQLVVAKVQAYNQRGWSDFSDPNVAGQLVQTEPLAMAAPTRGLSSTTQQI